MYPDFEANTDFQFPIPSKTIEDKHKAQNDINRT